MAATVVNWTSLLASATVTTSSSSVFTKLRSTQFLRLSFTLSPLCSRTRTQRMAQSLSRSTLGLTHPAPIQPPKVSHPVPTISNWVSFMFVCRFFINCLFFSELRSVDSEFLFMGHPLFHICIFFNILVEYSSFFF